MVMALIGWSAQCACTRRRCGWRKRAGGSCTSPRVTKKGVGAVGLISAQATGRPGLARSSLAMGCRVQDATVDAITGTISPVG